MATAEAVSAYHGNNYLPLLERFYRSHRPMLFTLSPTRWNQPGSDPRMRRMRHRVG